MQLTDTYRRVKKSIVAFIPKCIPTSNPNARPPRVFPIFGTGFIAREDGIVITNDHVVKAFDNKPKPPNSHPDEWGVQALLFHIREHSLLSMPIDVIGVAQVAGFKHGENYYGPISPDIALVRVKAQDLPVLEIGDQLIEEGMDVATSGFPMGTEMLTAPGWLHQIAPTLQKGIVSAVMPFECEEPHTFAVNMMVQGGASGSPVFDPETGKVLGLIYAGVNHRAKTVDGKEYLVPTMVSYAVPWRFLKIALSSMKIAPPLPEDTPRFSEMIARSGAGPLTN